MKRVGIDKLGVEDRLALLEEIWESPDLASSAVPSPAWQEDELRKRVAAFEADPYQGRLVEAVIAEIRRGR
ncbi:MAG: addiction module protein [Steroidobacteraceae bacterium]|jgi:putative addiction module component (TIGR02574 family)|nr:addiction module protein [Steroidobacteraceae bacterium]